MTEEPSLCLHGLDKNKLDKIAQEYTNQIIGTMTQIKAQTLEADILKALDLARRSFSSVDSRGIKHIVVLDSGLSTAGVFNLADTNFLAADNKEVINWLTALQAIPDFTDINISWYGLGDTAPPQQELSSIQKANLRNLWNEIIVIGGGTVTFCDTIQGVEADAADYPRVSLVNADSPKPPTFKTSAIVEPIFFSEEKVHFVGDKAIYVNESAAEAAIKPTAEYLIEQPGFTVLLVGATAGNSSNAFTYQLSRERANKVKETLVKFGVPADRIITLGLAASDPWHIHDVDSRGNLIEDIARNNRKVVLLDARSDLAKELLKLTP